MAKRQTPREKTLSKIADLKTETEKKDVAPAPEAAATAEEKKAAKKKSAPVAGERVQHDSTGSFKTMKEAAKELASFMAEHDDTFPFNIECYGHGDGKVHLYIAHNHK